MSIVDDISPCRFCDAETVGLFDTSLPYGVVCRFCQGDCGFVFEIGLMTPNGEEIDSWGLPLFDEESLLPHIWYESGTDFFEGVAVAVIVRLKPNAITNEYIRANYNCIDALHRPGEPRLKERIAEIRKELRGLKPPPSPVSTEDPKSECSGDFDLAELDL